jgi:hypothetical protein
MQENEEKEKQEVKDCDKSVKETEEEGRKRNDKKRRSAGNDRIGMGRDWMEDRTGGEDRRRGHEERTGKVRGIER